MKSKKDISELEKAKSWAKLNLVGKNVYHRDIQKRIHFTWQGIKHALSRTNTYKIELVYVAPQILQRARLYKIQEDKKKRTQIKKAYYLRSRYKNYDIYIVCREGANEVIYYDHGTIKRKKRPNTSRNK